MDTVAFAKAYASKGLQVFPLKSHDKVPLVKWPEVATSDVNMAVGYFDNDPDANIGIACGSRSGIVVLDVDAGHGGFESLQALQDIYGRLPETPTAKTGGGGEHIFFKHPGIEIKNSAGKLGAGLDIRGDGGYVVAAPSIHPNGNAYEWVVTQVPFADMPEWMIGKLYQKPQPTIPVVGNGKIANGTRNATLASLAGTMRRKGFDEDAIFLALKAHNEKNCIPPLTDGEVLQIAKSIQRYEPAAPPKPQGAPVITDIFDVLDNIEQTAIERQANPKEVWGIPYAWPTLSKVTGGKQPGEMIYIAGDSGIGKSWWAHQDALYTALHHEIPSLIWSGEMSREQMVKRFLYMLGVDRRAMLTGYGMEEYWQTFREAKALISNSPIRVSDAPLDLQTAELLLEREIGEHGIQQALFDYDRLINAPGTGDTEKSQNISRAFKQLAQKYNTSIMLISSMSKMGMDTTNALRSTMSGSAQKIYDSDIIYIFTALDESKVPEHIMHQYKPADYGKIITMTVSKGRDLDYRLPDKKMNFARETPRPTFKEIAK